MSSSPSGASGGVSGAAASAVRTLRALRVALVMGVAVVALARCSSCSEECSGDNAGNETCSCASDQDCTTRLGTVLLCKDGTCQKGDPEDAPGDACDVDADCGAGRGCGVDSVCLAAPKCERIDVTSLVARLGIGDDTTTTASFTPAREDCAHTWQAALSVPANGSFDVSFSIDLGGDMKELVDNGGGGCSAGHWFAGSRVGELTCTAGTWAIAPTDVTTCIGTAQCGACAGRVVDDATGVGVCP